MAIKVLDLNAGGAWHRFPRISRFREKIRKSADVATQPAFSTLEHVLPKDPRIPEALSKENFDYLTTIGFNFARLADTRVFSLQGEDLVAFKGKILSEESAAFLAMNAFYQRWYRKLEGKHHALWELWNNGPVGQHTLDLEGRITAVNATEAAMFGYRPEEMRGKNIFDLLIHPDQREIAQTRFRQKLAGKNVPLTQDRIYLRKDGKEINVSAMDRLNRDSNDKVIGVKTALFNMTEFRKVQTQLFHLMKMRDLRGVTEGFSHEFNNILMGIGVAAQMLEAMAKRPAHVRDTQKILGYIHTILEQCQRAKKIIDSILAFSRAKKPLVGTIETRSIASDIRESFVVDPNQITFKIEDSSIWYIEGDQGQLSQIIRNLLMNAKEAIIEKGEITLSIANYEAENEEPVDYGVDIKPGKYVIISVADTGAGISAEIRSRIFDPFFSTKSVRDSGGLGLSMTLGVVEASGGGIKMDTAPDRGTTISIFLPAIDPKAK